MATPKKAAKTKKAAKKATRKVAQSGREKIFAMRVTEEQESIIQRVPKAQAATLFEIACRTYNESFDDLLDRLPKTLIGEAPKTSQKLDSFRHCAVELGGSTAEAFLKIQSDVEKETGISFPIATLASIAANAMDPEYLTSLVLSLAAEAANVPAS